MASVLKRGSSYHIMVSCGYDLQGKKLRKTKNWRSPDGMSSSQIKKQLEKGNSDMCRYSTCFGKCVFLISSTQ